MVHEALTLCAPHRDLGTLAEDRNRTCDKLTLQLQAVHIKDKG